MLLSTHGRTAWTIINVVAAAVFLHLASWSWLEPNLRGEDVASSGDAVIWTLTAFPVLALAAVANLAWLSFAIRERRTRGERWPYSTILVVATIWVSALIVHCLRVNGL